MCNSFGVGLVGLMSQKEKRKRKEKGTQNRTVA
jgi:hypothetical protein